MTAARVLVGSVLACAVGVVTWRGRMLSPVGATVATLLGATAVAAGDPWWIRLLAFFIPAVAWSRWRQHTKAHLAGTIVDTAAPRNVSQVLANGGLFGVAAFLALVTRQPVWEVVALGALAAAAADTWATEVGIGSGATPWSLHTRGPVPHGTSGAVTAPGTVAMVLGGVWMGTTAWLTGFDSSVALAGMVGGVTGAAGDTILGATVQSRRWCPSCGAATERPVHPCGTTTIRHGGWPGMTNDVVNFCCTVTGGVTAVLVHRALA